MSEAAQGLTVLHQLSAVVGYLLGSIPFGLLLTRLAGMGDIRTLVTGVDLEDVTEVLGGDSILAEKILARARATVSTPAGE